MTTQQTISVSTPGRICLFGEHQDYLGLPVIAAAISRRIQIEAQPTEPLPGQSPAVHLNLPDMNSQEQFPLGQLPLLYQNDRDYFRSAVNVLMRQGFRFSRTITAEVRGRIPINAGTSSSSALLVSWLHCLSRLADNPQLLLPEQLAELAYRAEVLEFGEPGGMMDHYATAVGGVIYLESEPTLRLEHFSPPFGTFVLGDSGEPKDTIGILARVKGGMLRIVKQLTALNPWFSLSTINMAEVADYQGVLSKAEFQLLKGTLANRDILRRALTWMRHLETSAPEDSDVWLGALLTQHHAHLRDDQRISTPKIDRMLDAALKAGALGGKINGSGGGGCMFAYAPTRPNEVAEAIEREGGRAYIVSVDEGTQYECGHWMSGTMPYAMDNTFGH